MIDTVISAAILLVLCVETWMVHVNLKIQAQMQLNDKKIIKELRDKPETKIVVPAPVYEYEMKARCDE